MWLYEPKRLKLNRPKRNRAVLTGIKRELCRSIETGRDGALITRHGDLMIFLGHVEGCIGRGRARTEYASRDRHGKG